MKKKYRLKSRKEIKNKYSREVKAYAINLSGYPEDGDFVEFDQKFSIEDTSIGNNGEIFEKLYWENIDSDFPNNTCNQYTLFHFFDEVKVEKENKTIKTKDVSMNYVKLNKVADLELLLEKGYYFKVLGEETTIQKVKNLHLEKGFNVVSLRDDKSLGYLGDGGVKYEQEGMTLIDISEVGKSNSIIKNIDKKDLTLLGVGFVLGGFVLGGLIINKVRG